MILYDMYVDRYVYIYVCNTYIYNIYCQRERCTYIERGGEREREIDREERKCYLFGYER